MSFISFSLTFIPESKFSLQMKISEMASQPGLQKTKKGGHPHPCIVHTVASIRMDLSGASSLTHTRPSWFMHDKHHSDISLVQYFTSRSVKR